MIPFYRKIRKNLSDEHKFIKYFRYAIGEIALVVMGILIALQINNWNENRKERKLEYKLLRELHQDLEVTLEELNVDIPNLENQIKLGDRVIEYANDPESRFEGDEFRDTFRQFYWNVKLYPRTIAYQNLRSKGIDLFLNDSVRYLTADMFDRKLSRVALWESYVAEAEGNLIEQMTKRFNAYSIKEMSENRSRKIYVYEPEDFEVFLENEEILNKVANMQNKRGMQLLLYRMLKADILELIRMIEEVQADKL